MQLSKGFSLTEILIALLVVSTTAVNIVGLQKIVAQQGRDNFIYGSVLQLAIAEMNDVSQLGLISDLELLNGLQESAVDHHTQTELKMDWRVTAPENHLDAGDNLHNVELQINWQDSQGQLQAYIYRQQINLLHFMNMDTREIGQDAAIIESFLGSAEVIYYSAKNSYQKGAFVIYNSELFTVTDTHLAGDSFPRKVGEATVVAAGWKSYGLINNPELAKNPDLAGLF